MKVKSLIRALEKAGFKLEQNCYGQYYCYSETHCCSFYKNGGDSDYAVCVNVRRKDDHHDANSDYSAGFYAKTIKRVIEFMTR
jgi:hypothetical protein